MGKVSLRCMSDGDVNGIWRECLIMGCMMKEGVYKDEPERDICSLGRHIIGSMRDLVPMRYLTNEEKPSMLSIRR